MSETTNKANEYKLFLEYVIKMTERRGSVTSTYLSVNAAIAGAIALIFKDIEVELWGQQLAGFALLLAGVVACILWRILIRQYSTLLGWWYEKLRILETEIPDSAQLLSKEYADLYKIGPKKTTIGLTRYETRLTWLFTIIYGAFGLVILVLFIASWF